jgi:hypothetical protein
MALFPELWNAGRYRLRSPSREQAGDTIAIELPEFDGKRFGTKVLQENHPYGPELFLRGDFLSFISSGLQRGLKDDWWR